MHVRMNDVYSYSPSNRTQETSKPRLIDRLSADEAEAEAEAEAARGKKQG